MSLISPGQIARRMVLARDAVYQSATGHGAARSRATRFLHLLLLLAVVQQLVSSKLAHRPLPGDAPSIIFSLHEYIGIATLGLVLAFWLWTLIRHGETKLGTLLPWLSPRRIMAVINDGMSQLRAARSGYFSGESGGALASAVHGLGLLTVTGMAATGTVFFFAHGTVTARYALDLHRTIANLMWVYLFGHAGLACLHHLLGSDMLRRMFWIRRGITITTPRGAVPAPAMRPDRRV
jgi:cytochrome b561